MWMTFSGLASSGKEKSLPSRMSSCKFVQEERKTLKAGQPAFMGREFRESSLRYRVVSGIKPRVWIIVSKEGELKMPAPLNRKDSKLDRFAAMNIAKTIVATQSQ
ncbi:hypothetical protein SERLA73DRAFT_182610 [Serpula lacrymans var. lacrymans S7.3]|uniref:Uncharacterized protein n=1 Tax=Serpula lacrymans var. lacrymans (strain S7.3) TaxID=936435 RepID=F8Q0M7_SERL3|nr:hypothetical protein SERLA73DRAFT_182610 [Serpula lacrymans var. lacrymans S7.3]